MKSCLYLLFFIFTISCANWSKDPVSNVEQVTASSDLKADEEAFLKKKEESKELRLNCDGCIIGSSPSRLEDFKAGKKVYTLDEILGVKLKNKYFDFPVVDNQHTRKWVRYFQKKGRNWFVRSAERAGRYAPILSEILSENSMPNDLIYLAMAESGFQNKVVSWALAAGPWQFIKATGKKYGLNIDWYVDERLDPIKASFASSRYLSDLFDLFNSWELAAAGYNAGEGRVMRAIRRFKTRDFWKIRKKRYLRVETKDYVPKIMALAIIGKNLREFGFEREVEFQKPLEYEVVHVGAKSDLYLISQALQMSFEELKKWNPELQRWQTPHQRSYYPLRLPLGYKDTFKKCCVDESFASNDYKRYRIKSSGNLKTIARKFKVPVTVLMDLNKVKENQSYTRGQEVLLPFHEDHNVKNAMYKDLYRKRRRRRKKNSIYRHMARAKSRGKRILNPKNYVVKKGDTLWDVSRKTGTPLNNLIKTNLRKIKRGHIRPGQTLLVN